MTQSGHEAVARKLCQILERRHPGTTWVPAGDDHIAAPGETLIRLAPPNPKETLMSIAKARL